ncbi:MAG: putative endonuclease [Flavobacteriaceae bacterium]|jgi:putative endonuclease
MQWYVYIVKCSDDTLYTGVTTNISRRINEHNGEGKLGAKYTRARRPVELMYSYEYSDRSTASKEEYRIKKLTLQEKERLVIGK